MLLHSLHKAVLVKYVADFQAAIQNRHRFSDSSFNEDLETATGASNFLSNQAFGAEPKFDARKIMIADIAIQGWAIATTTEAYILLETGYVLEAKQILNSELLCFKDLASRWTELLLKSERPELATVYQFTGNRFKDLITNERVERIAMLSPMDTDLTEEQKHKKLADIEVEFEMSYTTDLGNMRTHQQIAESEYLDTLSELLARIEGMESFVELHEKTGVKSIRELLPDENCEPGLYLLNPRQEN